MKRVVYLLLLIPLISRAGGDVSVATHAALQAALQGGGLVRITTVNVISITNTITIAADTVLEGAPFGTLNANHMRRIFVVNSGVRFEARNIGFIKGLHNGGSQQSNGSTIGNPSFGGAVFAQ